MLFAKLTMSFPSTGAFATLAVSIVILCSRTSFGTLPVHDGCQGLLESFAEVTSKFTRCFIVNARPITVCLACVDTYINVVHKYQEILKLHKDDGSGIPCKLQLMNVDRLEVVQGSYMFVVNQWNRADCNNCFQNESNCVTPVQNDFTKDILVLADLLNSCVLNHSNGTNNTTGNPEVCKECNTDYLKLNEYYNTNKSQVHGSCMDIVDMINSTRSDWSQEFRCTPERGGSETIFLITAFSFCFIPFIFYLFVRLCTAKHLLPLSTQKRWERYMSSSSSTSNLIQS